MTRMTRKRKLIIFGSGMMAKVLKFYFDRDSSYQVVAFTVDRQYKESEEFWGLPVVDFEQVQTLYPPNEHDMFVAMGPKQMNQIRANKFYECRTKGYKLGSYISPYARCDSPVGENTFVADMAIIHPFVTVGENNYFWEYCFIGNDSEVGSHCYFSPKSIVSTFAKIDDYTLLGSAAVVKTQVQVAAKTLAGARSYVAKNTEEKGVYGEKGSPLYGRISDKIDISI